MQSVLSISCFIYEVTGRGAQAKDASKTRQAFASWDKDGSGELDVAEFTGACKKLQLKLSRAPPQPRPGSPRLPILRCVYVLGFRKARVFYAECSRFLTRFSPKMKDARVFTHAHDKRDCSSTPISIEHFLARDLLY